MKIYLQIRRSKSLMGSNNVHALCTCCNMLMWLNAINLDSNNTRRPNTTKEEQLRSIISQVTAVGKIAQHSDYCKDIFQPPTQWLTPTFSMEQFKQCLLTHTFPKKIIGTVANYWTIIGPAAGLWEVSRCLSVLESESPYRRSSVAFWGLLSLCENRIEMHQILSGVWAEGKWKECMRKLDAKVYKGAFALRAYLLLFILSFLLIVEILSHIWVSMARKEKGIRKEYNNKALNCARSAHVVNRLIDITDYTWQKAQVSAAWKKKQIDFHIQTHRGHWTLHHQAPVQTKSCTETGGETWGI